jgi:glycosyltransferase involved in cell wall biosynthesis
MNKPLVSIIIPVYNAGKYLEETIISAIEQTWENKEIIIVDDGSTDNSLAIAKNHRNGWIKVFSQQNKGAGAARNSGLKEAKGKYIQFLDADDLLNKNKIEAQMNKLIGHDGCVGLCITMHFQDGEDPLSYVVNHTWMATGSDDPTDFLIKLYAAEFIGPEYGSMVQPNAWLTPKSLIDQVGLWNEMRCPDDDGEFFCRVLLAAKGIKYATEAINYYRKFTERISWSAQKNHEASNNILQSTLLKVKYLTDATDDPRAAIALSRLLWENTFNLYPNFTGLAAIAEKKAKELAPTIKYNPYKTRLNSILAKNFGWKAVKYLQYLKQKLIL